MRSFQRLRQLAINNPPSAQDFCVSSRRDVGHIAGYVTGIATQKTDKKTSKVGKLFIASCLTIDKKLSRYKIRIRSRAKYTISINTQKQFWRMMQYFIGENIHDRFLALST